MDGGNEDDLYPIAILIDELKVTRSPRLPYGRPHHADMCSGWSHTGGWSGCAMGRWYVEEAVARAMGWWSVPRPSPGLDPRV